MSIQITISELYSLEHTLAKPYLEQFTYPWEALAGIGDFVRTLGKTLRPEEYDEIAPEVWVAKSATVAPTATIKPPCVIGPETEVRPGAFIRGNVLVGAGAVVGNSTELKNVILFDTPPTSRATRPLWWSSLPTADSLRRAGRSSAPCWVTR